MANRNSDLELALKIRTDLANTHAALHGTETGLEGVRDAAKDAKTALSGLGGDVKGVAAVGKAAEQAATGLQREAETADQAASRIKQMVQASLEYQRALEQQLASSEAASDATSRGAKATAEQAAAAREAVQAAYASQAATTAQIQSISELHSRVERGARSMEDLAETEQLLDRAIRGGLVSAEEQSEIFDKLNKQEKGLLADKERMAATRAKEERQVRQLLRAYDPASAALAKLEADEKKLKAAVDAGTISREKANRALVGIAAQRAQWQQLDDGVEATSRKMGSLKLTAREIRTSLASVGTSLAQGNIAGAGNSLLSLGTRGAAGMGAYGLAIGGVVAGLGLFVTAAWKSHQENKQLELSLIASGNAAGTTAGQMANIRNSTAAATGAYGDAQKAVIGLANSGKISAAMLETATAAALNLSELTGESIEQTTQKIIALAKAPSAQLVELNQQYNFLTLEVYENVQALEAQGRQTEATEAAVEAFAKVHEQRVREARERAGFLEQAWMGVKGAVLGAWQAIKDLGRTDVDARLDSARQALAEAQRRVNSWGFVGDHERAARQIPQLQALIASLEAEKAALDEKAASDQRNQEIQNAGVAAAKALQDQLDAGAPKAEKYAKAVAELGKKFQDLRAAAEAGDTDSPLLTDVMFGADGSISGGAYDKALKALQEQYRERRTGGRRGGQSEEQKAQDAARRDLENLQKQVSMLGDLEEGQTKAGEAARIRYEIEQGAYKNVSEALKSELVDHAQLLDGERQRIEMAKEMVNVRLELARLEGKGPDVELAKTTKELTRLQQQLENVGKTGDAADVAKLLNLTQASAELKGLRETYDRTMGQIGLEQQRIQVELQAGLITEADAQQKIVNLYRDKLGALRELVPQMRAAAVALGDPAALAAVEQIELKLREMAETTNLLQQSVRGTFQSAFKDAFMSLATAGGELDEVVRSFFMSIATGLADFAAEQLSQQLANRVTSMLFDKGADVATEAAGAAATQASAVALSAAAGAVTAGATAVTTSATALGTGGASLITGAAAVSAAAVQMQAAATAMMIANAAGGGFADGGWTGPGSKYKPAGIVHAEEFVHRREVVRQPGALPFLWDFNRRGMAALHDWRAGYAEGGLVTPPSISASPSYSMGGPALSAPSIKNSMSLYNYFDMDALAQALARHPAMEKSIVNVASQNGQTIKAEWQ